ncbi:TPA: phage major capsid protein [Mannheimia haemolytica]|nr:phage major capsid protein [Mannheimia haemolytica]
MFKKLLELRQQKAAIEAEMRSILTKADEEKRSTTEAEGAKFDELRSQAENLVKEIARYEAITDEQRNQPGQQVETANVKVSDDELRHWIKTGELRSLATNTNGGADGGYSVIPELDKQVMKRLTDDSVMRHVANVVKLTQGKEYKKLVSAGGAAVNHIGEGEARTETATPKMNEVTIAVHNIYAYPKTTQEILDFGGVDILGWLTEEISESFVETEETDLTNGTGTKQAKGFLAYPRTTANDKTRPFGTLQKMEVQPATVIGWNSKGQPETLTPYPPYSVNVQRTVNRQNWLTAYIPHSYDENVAETPHFDQWLNFVSDGKQDKAKNILAALYAILTNRYNWQVFFQVTGKGGSGKSVFAGIATLLAGEKNTASARLENFDDERKIAGLEDKKLIICSEQTKYAGDGGGLKAITGGDMVRVDPKNKHPFNARIAAMIMIVNNDPCKWTERNGGIDRRIVNFRFNKRPPENERDPYFMDKITLEIGGIIRKVLDTFPDPLEAKRALEEQKESLEALEIKKQSDPLTDFFEYLYTTENTDGLYIGTGNTLGHDKIRTHLYPAYLAFVKAKNVLELGLNTFVVGIEQAVKQHGNKHDFTKRKTNKGQRTNVHFKNFDDFQSDILN